MPRPIVAERRDEERSCPTPSGMRSTAMMPGDAVVRTNARRTMTAANVASTMAIEAMPAPALVASLSGRHAAPEDEHHGADDEDRSGASAAVSWAGTARSNVVMARPTRRGGARCRARAPRCIVAHEARGGALRPPQHRRRIDAHPENRDHERRAEWPSSRQLRSARRGSAGLSSGLNKMRWIAHSR